MIYVLLAIVLIAFIKIRNYLKKEGGKDERI